MGCFIRKSRSLQDRLGQIEYFVDDNGFVRKSRSLQDKLGQIEYFVDSDGFVRKSRSLQDRLGQIIYYSQKEEVQNVKKEETNNNSGNAAIALLIVAFMLALIFAPVLIVLGMFGKFILSGLYKKTIEFEDFRKFRKMYSVISLSWLVLAIVAIVVFIIFNLNVVIPTYALVGGNIVLLIISIVTAKKIQNKHKDELSKPVENNVEQNIVTDESEAEISTDATESAPASMEYNPISAEHASPLIANEEVTAAATNKKPSPAAFVIWLIATIVLLGGAITLGIFTCIWGDYYQDYKRGYEVAKTELEQPCDEFEDFIDACKSGEYDNFDDLEPYWDRYLEALESRSYYTYDAIAYDVVEEYGSHFSSIEWLARETKFSAYVYNNDYNASYEAIQPEYADKFEKALREECNGALQRQMNDCERWAKNDLFVLIVAFLIPGVICLTVGIIGIFVTIKQHKKLKKGRVAYESAIQERATAENLEKQQYLLKLEEMQRKIDALEGKAPMEVTSQSTMQTSPKRAEDLLHTASSPQQSTSVPTSANGAKSIK